MAAFEVVALVTNQARQREAISLKTGKSFKITHFKLGDEGHDPDDPTIALAPDPSSTTCLGDVFGPKAITDVEFVSTSCPVAICDLLESEAVAPLSAVCLIATIVYSPDVGDPEVGTTFQYAVGTFPLRVKTDLETATIRVAIQF